MLLRQSVSIITASVSLRAPFSRSWSIFSRRSSTLELRLHVDPVVVLGGLAVVMLSRFNDLGEAITSANSVAFGLAAYVFTQDATTAHLLSRRIQAGMVGINHFGVSTDGMPFGGVKDSGFGREGGVEGIQNYTIAKTISHLLV